MSTPPNQPEFPQLQPTMVQSVAPSWAQNYIPTTGYTYGMSPGMGIPQFPSQKLSHHDLDSIMSPSRQSRNIAQFEGSSQIQFTQEGGFRGLGINMLGNIAMRGVANQAAPGSAEALSYIPFQGLNGKSRFDFFMAMTV